MWISEPWGYPGRVKRTIWQPTHSLRLWGEGHTHTHTHTQTGYSSLNSKEIKPVNPKGNQPWIFIGRTDAEAEIPILWPPDMKSRLIGKETDAGKGWGQEEKGVMVGWHHWLNGHVFEHTPGDSKGSLACCNPWGCSRTQLSDWTTTGPSQLRCIWKEIISVSPDSCIFPYREKC